MLFTFPLTDTGDADGVVTGEGAMWIMSAQHAEALLKAWAPLAEGDARNDEGPPPRGIG